MRQEGMKVTGRRVWFRQLLVVAALGLVASACISGGESTPSKSGPPVKTAKEPTEPTTVTFASWVGNSPQMQKFAEAFHALHPNITIKFENIPAGQFTDKLTTEIVGGTGPDVAYMDSSAVADFASRSALVDLDPYIAGSDVVSADDYVGAFKTSATYQDHMYGLPFDGETTGLFYRTDMFSAAGITEPPKTWDELQADAAALTDPVKKQYGFILFAPESAYYWYPFLWQAGGQLLSPDGQEVLFNSSQGQEAANFYVGLRKYSPPDYYNSNSWDGRVAFANGQVAMYMAGSWFAGEMNSSFPKINGLWASAPLPEGPAGCATTIAGDTLVMLAGSQNQDAAWLWLEFLSSPQSMTRWTVGSKYSTLLPPRASLLNQPGFFDKKPYLAGFADNMKCAVEAQISNPKWPKIEQALNDKLGAAIYGSISPDEALSQAVTEAEQIIGG
jgi:multiple sugar transport system substrate-binding protein